MKRRPNLLAGEDLLPAPLQKRSQEKQVRLKAAGLAGFAAHGYERTSVDEIAKLADMPVGGFYQYFRSKRQLLLVLMDELLEDLSQLDLQPKAATSLRDGIHGLLSRSFSSEVRYLGAYRAWQEAVLSDPDLALKEAQIRRWTTARVTALFQRLVQLPNARKEVDVLGLASAMDSFFWGLLAQAARAPRGRLRRSIDSATHLIYHAMIIDP